MSVRLRMEQCCSSQGCTKPAHIGCLCAPCFMAATPARRATELLASSPVRGALRVDADEALRRWSA